MTFNFLSFIEKALPFFDTTLGFISFILFYILWVCFLLPGAWLTMLGGLLYGPLFGSFFVFIGACLGAEITFFLGRTFLKDWAQRIISKFPKIHAIEKALVEEKLRFVFLTRLSPVFPFSILNLFYSLSEISFRDFTIGLLGIIPGTILYSNLGALAGELSKFDDVRDKSIDLNTFLFNLVSILSTIFLIWLISNKTREILNKN